ncbi:MAG: carbon-phosphorus lyase complex subunit PhnI [Alphaproteobacteria bacterium]
MYVAVKGGERAIANAHRLLAAKRRGDPAQPEVTVEQIDGQLARAVDRTMAEGSLYDRGLAALAVKQAQGDLVEAIFLLRAARTSIPRFGVSLPLDTAAMRPRRRISATYKDLPGGQVLGPTPDYSHRLLDFALAGADSAPPAPVLADEGVAACMPRVTDLLGQEGLVERPAPPDGDPAPRDLTRQPPRHPASRAERLQNLARGDEGFLLALGYSAQRGFGAIHPFAGEIRLGEVAVEFVPEELGFAIEIGDITLTECQMIGQFRGSKAEPPRFTLGYGLVFGHNERKAMAMALVDRALRAGELGEVAVHPAQDEDFVLEHSDNVEASGFVQHLKLPHYVDFQAELELIRRLRADWQRERRTVSAETAEAAQ